MSTLCLPNHWQCDSCGLRNTTNSMRCIACFNMHKPRKSRNNNNNNNNTVNNSHPKPAQPLKTRHEKFSARKPTISSKPHLPMKISDCIEDKTVTFVSGYIRRNLDEYMYPDELVLLVNLYLTRDALFRAHQVRIDHGIKLCMDGCKVNGKGIGIIGFAIDARNRHLIYEWTVQVRTFNPPDSFVGIISNNHNNNVHTIDGEGHCDMFNTFDYAQNTFCCGIGGERNRVYKLGKLDRKIRYKSGWHCNNVSHWNDNTDVVRCKYDGRWRKLAFTKYVRNTNTFRLICTIKLPSTLPSEVTHWFPAIYLGHISDCAVVHY